ncbi:MAG TPA: DUF1549 domain-containing protein, partial [Verrucomicrobiae bacterium]|nr:DUF1549 domain-containing protein [Verrucomicrobiae bacterium]
KVATGFHRNSMVNEEGGVDPEEFRIAAIINRVETTSKAWLGLTMNCAQCHSHKYDPISQREYYQFFAFLNNDDEPMIEVPSKEQQARRAEILAGVKKIEDDLRANDPDLKNRQAAWEKERSHESIKWEVLDPSFYYGSVGAKFDKLADHSLLAGGSKPPVSSYTVQVKTKLTNITAFRLEVLTDPNLPHNGPGRAENGNFVLTQFSVQAVSPDGHTNDVKLQNATADFSQPDFSITNTIDGKDDKKRGWAIDAPGGLLNQDRKAVFETKDRIGYEEGTTLIFTLAQLYGHDHTIGRFRLSATTREEHPIKADPLTRELREIVDLPVEKRTPEQAQTLFSFYRTLDPKCAEANKKIEALQKEWPAADTTLILAARAEPRVTHVFQRGDFRHPLQAVRLVCPRFCRRCLKARR